MMSTDIAMCMLFLYFLGLLPKGRPFLFFSPFQPALVVGADPVRHVMQPHFGPPTDVEIFAMIYMSPYGVYVLF